MYAGRRITAIRVTALAALAVSAILYADSLHPGRAFCPLAAACEKARSSALGKLFGVPTSVVGMAAFGGLFFLSMLRVEYSRALLRPAGFMAALVGAGLFGYQALVIHSFCPLCLVADTAGLVAGLIVLTWPATPVRRSGKRLFPESLVARLRWMTAALVIVAAPFLWPRPEKPSWVAIPDDALTDVAALDGSEGSAGTVATGADAGPAANPDASKKPERLDYVADAEPTDAVSPADRLPPPPPAPRPSTTVPGNAVASMSTVPAPSRAPSPAPRSVPTPRPAPPPPPPPRADLTIVEYLNAFCSHCRATHQRLEQVIASEGVTVRRRRIYTWSASGTPMWARAVAFAQTQGLEDRMFAELVRAENESPGEIYAAADRAGVDSSALQYALEDGRLWPRLENDRRLAAGARLEGLPTLDIGRRRLMGEQSEDELRDAIRAALPPSEPAR